MVIQKTLNQKFDNIELCKICGNRTNNKTHIAREMMFGSRDQFKYLECDNCGCLQICEIPENIAKYYPENYNAYHKVLKTKNHRLKRFFKLILTDYCLNNRKKIIGFYLKKIFGCGFLEKIKDLNLNLNSKILDIGSGDGHRLLGLCMHGFTNITGIDPFIEKDIHYENGLSIFKRKLEDEKNLYDFIMLNHSYEHMDEPLKVLKNIYKLLKPHNFILIRIPVAGSYSWKKYGVNWVALDAPRHFFLHTSRSIKILAEEAGFQLKKVIYDSSEYQFWGSEQYANDIPMRDPKSYYENPNESMFSKKKIKEYIKHAKELNKSEQGDAACFYLYKA